MLIPQKVLGDLAFLDFSTGSAPESVEKYDKCVPNRQQIAVGDHLVFVYLPQRQGDTEGFHAGHAGRAEFAGEDIAFLRITRTDARVPI